MLAVAHASSRGRVAMSDKLQETVDGLNVGLYIIVAVVAAGAAFVFYVIASCNSICSAKGMNFDVNGGCICIPRAAYPKCGDAAEGRCRP